MHATCHFILLDLKHTSYEAPHYAVFFTLPLLPPSYIQLFYSATCSQTTSIYALPNTFRVS